MIVRMNEGRCVINIVEDKVNTLIFENTKEKDEFLFNFFDIFKIKHKRDLWDNYVSITDNEYENIEAKSYEVFILNPELNNVNEDKEFQKLLVKYINTFDSCNTEIDELSVEVKRKLIELVNLMSNEMEFSKMTVNADDLGLSQLLKGVDIKLVDDKYKEYSSLGAKIKFLDLISVMSQSNKKNIYLILYPEANIGFADYEEIYERILSINSTVIVITNTLSFVNKKELFDSSYIVCNGLKVISFDRLYNDYICTYRDKCEGDFLTECQNYLLMKADNENNILFDIIIE